MYEELYTRLYTKIISSRQLAREAGLPAVAGESLLALQARLRAHYGGVGRAAGGCDDGRRA